MDERAKELAAIAAQRWRVALSLTVAMMFIYFGFILLIAFNKPLMGSLVLPGLSLGILLDALVAGLTLSGAAALSHDLWVNVVRGGHAN